MQSDPPQVADTPPEMYQRDGLFAQTSAEVAFALLWFEFLAISPSYELARRYEAGEWTEADELKRPADFERVLQVYRDLGDVQRQLFRRWWLEKAFDFFGYRGERPKVQAVAKIFRGKEVKPDISAKAAKYIDGAWQQQGQQRTMVVAIPVGLPKARILKQVEKLLETYPEDKRTLRHKKPKYALAGKRQDKHSLFRYLMVNWVRMQLPNERLWRIGVLTNISSMYSGRLNAAEKPGHGEKTADRAALNFLIYRGRMIAENAARGVFPSYSKCEHAVKPDLTTQHEMRVARRQWQVAAKRQYSPHS